MKILIVDDELLVRIGVKTILEGLGIPVEIRTAEDGMEALEMFQTFQPRLVFVDINMPKLYGLDFLRLARQKSREAKFVVLTCYTDLESVRTAMKLGASDYVIKTELNQNTITRIVWECMEGEQEDLAADFAEKQQKQRLSATEAEPMALEAVLQKVQQEFEGETTVVLCAHRRSGQTGKQQPQASVVSDLLEGILSDYGKGYLYFRPDGEKFLFLVFRPCRSDAAAEQMLARELGQQIVDSMKTYFNEEYSIGGVLCKNTASLVKAVEKAEEWALQCFYDSEQDVFLCSGGRIRLEQEESKKIWEGMKRLLDNGEYQNALELLQVFLQMLKKEKPANIEFVIRKLFDLFYLILLHIQQNYPQLFSMRYLELDYRIFFQDLRDLAFYAAKIQDMLHILVEEKGSKDAGTGSKGVVAQAKAYIAEHLENELDLQTVSAYVNLSPSHFTRVFKEMEGVTFIDYCIEQRIERAKAYINGGDKIFIAAEKVGYQNYSYFSKLFKRITGLTPEEYRRQQKSSGE